MPLTLQQKKGFQPINHHFWPVIVPRREFVKYLAKIGMKIIFGKTSCAHRHTQRSHSICCKQHTVFCGVLQNGTIA